MVRHHLLAVVGLTLGACPAADAADDWLQFQVPPGNEVAVSTASETVVRVGQAAIIWVFWKKRTGTIVFADQYLLACDGSWISTPLQSSIHEGPNWLSTSILRAAIGKDKGPILEPIEFESTRLSNNSFAAALSARSGALCKLARPSRETSIIPFADGRDSRGEFIKSFVLAGAKVKNGQIELWTRTDWYRIERMVDKDGLPLTVDGSALTARKLVGTYRLHRQMFDCSERTVVLLDTAHYEANALEPIRIMIPHDERRAEVIVPDSLGEKALSAACLLFLGKRGRNN